MAVEKWNTSAWSADIVCTDVHVQLVQLACNPKTVKINFLSDIIDSVYMFLFLRKFTLKMQWLCVTCCVHICDRHKHCLLSWWQHLLWNSLSTELKYFLCIERSWSQVSSFSSAEKINFRFRVQNCVHRWQVTNLHFHHQPLPLFTLQM